MNDRNTSPASSPPVLDGVRVLEFSTGIAGPIAGRALAHHGAEVLKIELPSRPDTIRLFPPAWATDLPSEVARDLGPMWSEFNAGKRSVGIDVTTPRGAELVRQLARQSDVVLINFSASTATKWGLEYSALVAVNPSIVYLTMPGFGDAPGPYREHKVWGPNLAALTGIDYMTGWPDRPPSGVGSVALPDYLNGVHAVFMIVAALCARQRTGKGRFVDISQFETTVSALGASVLAQRVGKTPTRTGNRGSGHDVQGVFPTCGNDQWIAITVDDDAGWAALCDVAGRSDWNEEPFATRLGRAVNQDELESNMARWTRHHTAADLTQRLQTAGVAAFPVTRTADVAADPQLEARQFWQLLNHGRLGTDLVTGHPIRPARSRTINRDAGPVLGQDTHTVLTERGLCSEPELHALERDGVVFTAVDTDIAVRRPYLDWIHHLMPFLAWPTGTADVKADA